LIHFPFLYSALEQIRLLQGAPSVQMQEIPPGAEISDDEDENDPNMRYSQRYRDNHVEAENEYYRDDRDNDHDDEDLDV